MDRSTATRSTEVSHVQATMDDRTNEVTTLGATSDELQRPSKKQKTAHFHLRESSAVNTTLQNVTASRTPDTVITRSRTSNASLGEYPETLRIPEAKNNPEGQAVLSGKRDFFVSQKVPLQSESRASFSTPRDELRQTSAPVDAFASTLANPNRERKVEKPVKSDTKCEETKREQSRSPLERTASKVTTLPDLSEHQHQMGSVLAVQVFGNVYRSTCGVEKDHLSDHEAYFPISDGDVEEESQEEYKPPVEENVLKPADVEKQSSPAELAAANQVIPYPLPTSFGKQPDLRVQRSDRPENVDLNKYYYQRYRYFSRYDEGCLLDEDGWYSVTCERIAEHIADRFSNVSLDVIIDLYSGVGGNSIQFALQHPRVIAVDIVEEKMKLLKNNASIYGVVDNIEFRSGDAIEMLHILKGELEGKKIGVFLSPPWGGPGYIKETFYDVKPFKKVIEVAKQLSNSVAILLPKNIDLDNVGEVFGECETEFNYLGHKVKCATVYFGDLIQHEVKDGCTYSHAKSSPLHHPGSIALISDVSDMRNARASKKKKKRKNKKRKRPSTEEKSLTDIQQ